MTRTIEPRTNGDRVQPAVDRARKVLAEGIRWAREHPDEVAVAVLPTVMLSWAVARHRLNPAEDVLVFMVGDLCGQLALAQYRQWKTRPARPSLKEVV